MAAETSRAVQITLQLKTIDFFNILKGKVRYLMTNFEECMRTPYRQKAAPNRGSTETEDINTRSLQALEAAVQAFTSTPTSDHANKPPRDEGDKIKWYAHNALRRIPNSAVVAWKLKINNTLQN